MFSTKYTYREHFFKKYWGKLSLSAFQFDNECIKEHWVKTIPWY